MQYLKFTWLMQQISIEIIKEHCYALKTLRSMLCQAKTDSKGLYTQSMEIMKKNVDKE